MAIGAFTHIFVMSGVVIGSVYALLFSWMDISSGNGWWAGALLCVVHGVLGGLAMAMVPAIHPRIGSADTGGAATLARTLRPQLRQRDTPGVLMTHILYGLVLGAVYGMLIT